jgi:hypothetical protein
MKIALAIFAVALLAQEASRRKVTVFLKKPESPVSTVPTTDLPRL